MTPAPDCDGWFTKQAAADAIGVSTKTIERLAQAGALQQGGRRRDGRGPVLTVYHPGDVERLRQERQPEASTFVLPRDRDGDGEPLEPESPGALAARVLAGGRHPAELEILRGLAAAAWKALMSETSQTPAGPVFLSLLEAAHFTGLSPAYLRRLVKAGKLEAVRDRGLKFRRRDLEAL